MTTRNCNILLRWWHRRQRQIDRTILLPAIERGTTSRGQAIAIWELHKALPGSGCWQCECARLEEMR